MKRLASSKLNKILDSISILNSSVEPQTLPERTVKAVSNVIEYHGVGFDVVGSNGHLIRETSWHDPAEVMTEHLYEMFSKYLSEHMFFDQLVERRTGVFRNTDALSVPEFAKTNLYNEFYKKLDVTHQLHAFMPLNEDMLLSCTLSRDNFDFSDEEKQILQILSPHLTNAISNSNAFEKIVRRKSRIETALDRLHSGAIVFDENGKVLQRTKSSQDLIAKYFHGEKFDIHGIPRILRRFLKLNNFRSNGKVALAPPQPLIIENGEDQMRISVVIENRKRRKILLFEEKLALTLTQGLTLGLTPRESQVLLLIAKGKTNPEIAIILGISPRTAQKHTENIFVKLGVETRTAAALRANELH